MSLKIYIAQLLMTANFIESWMHYRNAYIHSLFSSVVLGYSTERYSTAFILAVRRSVIGLSEQKWTETCCNASRPASPLRRWIFAPTTRRCMCVLRSTAKRQTSEMTWNLHMCPKNQRGVWPTWQPTTKIEKKLNNRKLTGRRARTIFQQGEGFPSEIKLYHVTWYVGFSPHPLTSCWLQYKAEGT